MNTIRKGRKRIEVVGQDMSYEWRSDIRNIYEVTLEFMKISDVGPKGTLADMIPSTM